MQDTYDAIVIGSGFGGAVTACRLSEAGLKVLVLERGRRWNSETYPRAPGDAWVWDQRNPAKKNGWLDFRVQRGVCVAQGSGVGGGSLIYANVLIDAQPWMFDFDWPPEITFQELQPYYKRVEAMLCPTPVPLNQLPERLKIVREAAEHMGHSNRFRALPLAITFDPAWDSKGEHAYTRESTRTWVNPHGKTQGTCIHCGNCYIGCPVHARNTLDLNYLARAENKGAEVRPLHIVRCVSEIDGSYRVDFDRIEHGRLFRDHQTAPIVIVAAGSLGSTELLLRCRDDYKTLPRLSAALGQNWSANGDFLTVSVHERNTFPTQGPTITAAIDFLDGSQNESKFFVEDGGFPEVFRIFFEEGIKFQFKNLGFNAMVFGLAVFLRRFGGFNQMMPWFAQSIDASRGELYLGRSYVRPWKKHLKLHWDVATSKKTIDAVFAMHKQLAIATGGKPLIPFAWTMLKTLITPHPLGGCRVGRSADDGVVNHQGEAFNYRNLFVADGSVVPKAIGLNPSKTIAALAERTAELMLQK
jgi:cholesterol oxidase